MGRLFGTDGIRGIAGSELSCSLALEVGRAAGAVLGEGRSRRATFVIGEDTRASSSMLTAAVSAGICASGADVICLGVVPTPAVAYLIGYYGADAGVVITASHNPFEYNGIKIFGGDGHKLADLLEDRIEAIVLDGADSPICPTGNAVGRITRSTDAVRAYLKHLCECTPVPLSGLRIAVDCANGAASATARALFSALGAEATVVADSPNGVNVNVDCGSTHMHSLAETVRHGEFHCGVAFDGDADRCLFVDENGHTVDGDRLMAICALDLAAKGQLKNRTVVGTVMTNLGFSRFCEENGLRFVATKVGDRYVLEEMVQEELSFGGEQSGHIIFRDLATTGDGQLTALRVLSVMKERGKPLSELASVMKVYPQVTVNVRAGAEGKRMLYTDREICDAVDRAREGLGTRGRIVIRPSGTEPLIRIMAEGEDMDKIRTVADHLAKIISDRIKNGDKEHKT